MKLFLIFLLFIIGGTVNAQNSSIEITSSLFVKDSMINTSVLFAESDGHQGHIVLRQTEKILTSSNYPKEYYVQHYNKELQLINEITLVNEGKKQFKGLIVKDGKISLIQFEYDKTSSSIIINILKSKIESLSFIKQELTVLDQEDFTYYFDDTSYLKDNLRFYHPIGKLKFSNNREFFTIQFELVEKKQQDYHLIVYNNSLEKQFETHYRNTDKYSVVQQIEVQDIDGSILLLQKNFKNESLKFEINEQPNFNYSLKRLKDEQEQQIVIDEDNVFINALFIASRKGKISLIGFYGNINSDLISGACRYNINEGGFQIQNGYFEKFPDQLAIDKYEKGIEEKVKKFGKLNIRNLFLDDFGNITLSAEEHFVGSKPLSFINPEYQPSYRAKTFSERDKHFFKDILSLRMSFDGQIIWSRVIKKNQIGLKKSSFTTVFNDEKVHYFFNGNENKIKNDRIEFTVLSPNRSSLYMVTISNKGKVYTKLLGEEKSRIWYDVSNAIISHDGRSVIFQGVDRREKQIVQISM
ncbi:MAG: hypothetical protein ABF274_08545 [Nonlabens sp.]|uniref:hypothetical protein n=1 Tax=Nonlabens sp. TaxID=1888209 RepID=UPI00321A38D9